MNYGRFFEFDFESSYLQKGIAVFNYRWLKKKDASDKTTPRYPIYLTFTPESFSFNIHHLNKAEASQTNKKNTWNHYHKTIIEIRLSPNVDVAKGLNESLNNAYDTQFPLKAIERSGHDITTVDDELLDLIKDSFDKHDCSVEGYSQLDCFEPEAMDVYDVNNDSKPHLLRKIILDFLFDYEFSNVFKNVAFYDELSAKLKENFLFNALMCKTRYYYYRIKLSEKEVVGSCSMLGDGEKEMKRCDQGLMFFFEQYAKAEREWVNCILDERAMKVFHESPWFEEAHTELEQVYFAKRPRKGKWKRKEGAICGQKQINEIPSVSPVDDVFSVNKTLRKKTARIKYIHRINADKDPFVLTVSNVLNLVCKKSPEFQNEKKMGTFGKEVIVHKETARSAAFWEISHYHFGGLLKLWFGDTNTFLKLIIPLILVGVIVWKAGESIYHANWENSALLRSEWKLWERVDWCFIFIVIILTTLLLLMRRVIRRYFRSTWGEGSMALMMPRLLAAVTTAWFTMMMSVDIFQVFIKRLECMHWPSIIILSLMTILFQIYEARLKNPFDTWTEWIMSSVIVFLIAYIYAIIVGCLCYNFFGGAMACCEEVMDEISPGNPLKIPSKNKYIFVAQFSFFATFIGIFLQLMFQGKSVTETK